MDSSSDERECTFCLDVPTKPVTLPCGHIFCEDCLDSYVHKCERAKRGLSDNVTACGAEGATGPGRNFFDKCPNCMSDIPRQLLERFLHGEGSITIVIKDQEIGNDTE